MRREALCVTRDTRRLKSALRPAEASDTGREALRVMRYATPMRTSVPILCPSKSSVPLSLCFKIVMRYALCVMCYPNSQFSILNSQLAVPSSLCFKNVTRYALCVMCYPNSQFSILNCQLAVPPSLCFKNVTRYALCVMCYPNSQFSILNSQFSVSQVPLSLCPSVLKNPRECAA